MDSLKKLEEINSVNEGIFSNIFGKKQNDKVVADSKNGIGYFLNGNYIKTILGDFPYDKDLWNERAPALNWLLRGKYEADKIVVENKTEVYFLGKWYEGDFKGKVFSWGAGAEFNGGEFRGQAYKANNSTYKAGAENYYTGTFADYINGILGTNLYTSEINDTENFIELIRVPDNWVITLKGDRNKSLTFRIIKKIDDKNTDFIFELIPSTDKVKILWENIRVNYRNNGIIAKGNAFELFGGENIIQDVKSIIVASKAKEFKMASKSTIDFSLDKRLKGFLQTKNKMPVSFDLISSKPEQKTYIQGFINDLKNGDFYDNLKLLEKYINLGAIDGYLKYIFMAPIFDNEVGQIKNKQLESEINELLKYFNDFMYFIVEKAGKIGVKNAIIKSMKKELGIINKVASKSKTPQQSKNTQKNQQIINTLKGSL